ncbi:glycosyltransferase [Paenibacillus sp. FSL R10-2734]|uniref:glycosyltransferase family 2 protein n=1 Tax=Paenibacillus sp. FSL R10-2734 TaxID=2954691 RepID=UPI0030D8F1F3
MVTKPLVSVVVAVYNMQDTLDKCIQSLICQTLKQIEIILVDDGSIDSSGKICDKYASKDTRIRVIHQKNSGLPMSRLAGLNEASGEFLNYIDADDWCEPNMMELLYNAASKNNADIVFCSAYRHRNDGIARICNLPIDEGLYTKNDIHDCYILPLYGDLKTDNLITTGYVWCSFFRKSILRNIKFYKDICMHEDEIIVIQALSRAKSIYVIADPLYNYNRLAPNSLSKRTIYWENYWENIIDVYEAKREFSCNFFTDDSEYMDRLTTYLYLKLFRSIRNETHYTNPAGIWGGLKNVYKLKSKKYLFKNKKYIVKSEFSPVERSLIRLTNCRLYFLVYIYYLIKCNRMRTYVEKTKN